MESFSPVDKTLSLFYTNVFSTPSQLIILASIQDVLSLSTLLLLLSILLVPLIILQHENQRGTGLFLLSLPQLSSGAVNTKSIIFLKGGKGRGLPGKKKLGSSFKNTLL